MHIGCCGKIELHVRSCERSDGIHDPLTAQAEEGRLPKFADAVDARAVIQRAHALNGAAAAPAEMDDDVPRLLAFGAAGQLGPMAAMFGGLLGQELVKAATGKFHPLHQWLYFDSLESLPNVAQLTPAACASQARDPPPPPPPGAPPRPTCLRGVQAVPW